jgi:hypothetical protein
MEKGLESRRLEATAEAWHDATSKDDDTPTRQHAQLMGALYEIAYQLAVANELKAGPPPFRFVVARSGSVPEFPFVLIDPTWHLGDVYVSLSWLFMPDPELGEGAYKTMRFKTPREAQKLADELANSIPRLVICPDGPPYRAFRAIDPPLSPL